MIVGGGVTGIETAAEMPDRLRSVLGEDAKIRVVIVEQAATVGPELGAVPRPVIDAALAECGVEIVTQTPAPKQTAHCSRVINHEVAFEK